MDPDLDWAVWSRERQQRIEQVLDASLPPARGPCLRLAVAMRYATLGAGKRVRPLLAYAAGEFAGAAPDAVDAPAAAVEMIHAYSLVHDDMPCMDDDSLRRGRPTCHVAFGEAMALLAGDALQALAFATIVGAPFRDPAAACAVLAKAAGIAGMAGGQALDLAAVGGTLTLAELETMHRRKTGALIAAAVRLGAMAGWGLSAAEGEALDRYAGAAGLAFQVIDDVLDASGSDRSLGKTPGKDAAKHKPTFVSLLGVDESRRRAERLREDAREALTPFAGRGRRLAELSDWIVLREH